MTLYISSRITTPMIVCECDTSPFKKMCQESPAAIDRAPVSVCHSNSVRRNLNSHDVLQHAVEAAEDGELVHLLRDLLQRFELLQAQQRRVFVHEACRVQKRTRCRG